MKAMTREDYQLRCAEIISIIRLLTEYNTTQILAFVRVAKELKNGELEDDTISIIEEYDKMYNISEKEMIT